MKLSLSPEDELPVELPPVDEYKPERMVSPTRAGHRLAHRDPSRWTESDPETNTMPQWAGSCWYYLRYIDPTNTEAPWDKALEDFWMPVDLYVGGIEHAVLHLLYARFWHKVLYDCDLVTTKEPFQKLFNQGMILAYSYRDSNGKYYNPEDVDLSGAEPKAKATGETHLKIEKMSKVSSMSSIRTMSSTSMVLMRCASMNYSWDHLNGQAMADGRVEGVYRFLAELGAWLLMKIRVA